MIRRRAAAAGIATKVGNHSFRATGITAYLKNGGTLENAAAMANHASTRTTQLYDRRRDAISLDEVERIRVCGSGCDGILDQRFPFVPQGAIFPHTRWFVLHRHQNPADGPSLAGRREGLAACSRVPVTRERPTMISSRSDHHSFAEALRRRVLEGPGETNPALRQRVAATE